MSQSIKTYLQKYWTQRGLLCDNTETYFWRDHWKDFPCHNQWDRIQHRGPFCDENRWYGSYQFIPYIECEEVEGVPVDLFRGMVELSKLKKSSLEDHKFKATTSRLWYSWGCLVKHVRNSGHPVRYSTEFRLNGKTLRCSTYGHRYTLIHRAWVSGEVGLSSSLLYSFFLFPL